MFAVVLFHRGQRLRVLGVATNAVQYQEVVKAWANHNGGEEYLYGQGYYTVLSDIA